MDENQLQRTIKDLWVDYLFLTREMKKCIVRRDMDLFEEIMKQREALQGEIDQLAGECKQFTQSVEGGKLLREIWQENEDTRKGLQHYKNTADTQVAVARSYENVGASYVGKHMDWQR